MHFAEKLSFLLHITKTSNKELAAALGIDRSMVSLMRTGKRNLPRNPVQVQRMALFFARRSTAEFQRQALSEMLGHTAIGPSMPTDVLAGHLEHWLRGDPDMVDTMLDGIRAAPAAQSQLQKTPAAPVCENQSMYFFGEDGRREAMQRVLQEILRMDTPGSILIAVDDNLEWLLSDYLLTRQIHADLAEILSRGFIFYQIMPPANYINRLAESLQFWLPLYATGQMKVFYYPRLRGNLFRHSIIIVPGRCVQYSSSVGMGSSSDIVMFSTDPVLVDAFTRQYHEYLSLCRPALTPHSDPADSIPCFLDILSRPGDTIQMINSVSINTAPRQLLERCIRKVHDENWVQAFQMYLDGIPRFEERLKNGIYIDISRLSTAREVRAGTVRIASMNEAALDCLYYTPETYCLHLQNILRLMEQHENYYFVPLRDKDVPDYNLIVNESGLALLIHTVPPISVLEIHRPEMVTACREHLLRKAEAVGYDGIQREKVRMELRALIRELQA